MEYNIMEYLKRQGKTILLSILFASLVPLSKAEQLPNKPFKVCPAEAQPKDYPCIAMGPTAVIAQRKAVKEPDVIIKEKIIYTDNPALIERIKQLEAQVRELQSR